MKSTFLSMCFVKIACTIGANSGANMFSIVPGIKSGSAALEMLIFSNNFCTPFKVKDKFSIDGYLLPNYLGVAVVLFNEH